MSPNLATALCVFIILYLFWIARENSKGVSKAILIPMTWLLLAGSRNPSLWLHKGSTTLMEAATEGSPIDASIYFTLILLGILALFRRRSEVVRLVKQNKWLLFYFAYCGLSILWSDYPWVATKRWIKELGNPIMVIVILTEAERFKALASILRAFAFILLPVSLLFIMYYPQLGRIYHMGMPMVSGVSGNKNGVGLMCLISSIYFSWEFILHRKYNKSSEWRLHYSIYLIMLPLIIWLMHLANSATSMVCAFAAIVIFLLCRSSSVERTPEKIIYIGLIGVIVIGTLSTIFDLKDLLLSILNRRPDLTDRMPLWENLLCIAGNPIIGTGFMSFWSGDRLNIIFDKIGTEGVQAHNGYLEQYLNLGYIGVILILIIAFWGFINIYRSFHKNYEMAMLRLCIIVVTMLYNFTEAAFYGVNPLWLTFLLAVFCGDADQVKADKIVVKHGAE